MKRGNFFANCVFAVSVILTVLSFSACTDDSNDVVATTSEVIEQAEVPFSVVLKAMNSDGNDITTKGEVNGATLFVFDQNNDFFEQINVNKSTILSRRAIDINCPNSNDITVIAWSAVSYTHLDVYKRQELLNPILPSCSCNPRVSIVTVPTFGRITISVSFATPPAFVNTCSLP